MSRRKIVKNTRKCNVCKRDVLELVPSDNILGLTIYKEIKIIPFLFRENKLWCNECYEKHLAMKGV